MGDSPAALRRRRRESAMEPWCPRHLLQKPLLFYLLQLWPGAADASTVALAARRPLPAHDSPSNQAALQPLVRHQTIRHDLLYKRLRLLRLPLHIRSQPPRLGPHLPRSLLSPESRKYPALFQMGRVPPDSRKRAGPRVRPHVHSRHTGHHARG